MNGDQPQSGGPVVVATSAIDALRGSPVLLMLILLVAIVMGLVAWSVQKAQDRQQVLIERLMDRCLSQPAKAASSVDWARGGGKVP